MRYPPQQKAETRRRILDAAGRLFRRDGYDASGVDALMAEAGLTAGGFYRHFESKEQLLAEALSRAVDQRAAIWRQELHGLDGATRVQALVDRYLSVEHLSRVEDGCPLPPLAAGASRSSDRVRAAVARGVEGMSREIAEHLPGADAAVRRSAAVGLVGLMVGAVALARALPDREQAERLLAAARHTAATLIADHGATAPQES